MGNNENISKLGSLITRLKKAKIVKLVGALTIAAVLTLSLASCEYLPTPDEPPLENNGEENNGGNDNENNQEEDTIDLDDYSQLLQNILTNEEYRNVITRDTILGNFRECHYYNHPMAFLETQGVDISKIKSGELEAFSMSYVLAEEPNNIYIYTRIDNLTHYTNYLVKYELTDDEMDDYHLLHNGYRFANYYVQAFFMNYEISKNKTPEFLGTANIDKEVYDEMADSIGKQSTAPSRNCMLILTNPKVDENEVTIRYFCPTLEGVRGVTESKFIKEVCWTIILMKDEIYISPSNTNCIDILNRTTSDATIYLIQDAYRMLFNFETSERPETD